ncbi:MAG: hypothetical protein FJ405_05070 [Verrucomicrobia bacterium]|nr:hypothetical protein [Verrucomicrobiota bacterium]
MSLQASGWTGLGIAFLGVFSLVFVLQTWPFRQGDRWLPGTHADGPFHFYNQLARRAPDHFRRDLAVIENRSLGAYEYFYRLINLVTSVSGTSLSSANMLVCWAANALYLAGIMVLLHRLQLHPLWCAVGAFIASQPFVLIGMWSGVVHSLAIPREVCLWPLPWFVLWFLQGPRDSGWMLLFYACLGAVYCLAYPLWAVLFGILFGIADLGMILTSGRYSQLAWLVASAVVCIALVALPSLTTFKAVSCDGSAVLDYNAITRSVYFTKGFRRLLVFSGLALVAWWWMRDDAAIGPLVNRMGILLASALLVCLAYEPVQRLMPQVSLLYPGRLSLVPYLIFALLAAVALNTHFATSPRWAQGVLVLVLLGITLDRQRWILEESRPEQLASNLEFVRFAERIREVTPVDSLCLMPPLLGSHYFRVHAERGLWIDPKDLGILSRSRKIFDEAQRRLGFQKTLFAAESSNSEREKVISELRAAGVNFLVVTTAQSWGAEYGLRQVLESGRWRLLAIQEAAQ